MHSVLLWEKHFQAYWHFFSDHKITLRALKNVQYMTMEQKMELFLICPEKHPLVHVKQFFM